VPAAKYDGEVKENMYEEIQQYMKETLEGNDDGATKSTRFPFRKRSEHINRVFIWATRLLDGEPEINQDAVQIAALFHDIGYAVSAHGADHAEHSAALCEKYLLEKGYDTEFICFVTYLVRNHSNKELLTEMGTPPELIVLMEADLLDETGALSIVWDCMMEGAQPIQSFDKTYRHIQNYSKKSVSANPMVTAKAKAFWERKQTLMEEFVGQLAFDLGIEE
jgi:uncharacterized protein